MAVNIIFVLFMTLFIAFIQLQVVDGTVNTPTENSFVYPPDVSPGSLIMPENCTEAFNKFSESVINFTNCFMINARPIQACMKCGDANAALHAAYQHFKNQNPQCQKYYFGSDKFGIIDIMYKNGNDLWAKGNCQNCYGWFKNDTEKFFQASNAFVLCLETTNNTKELTVNSTCIKCSGAYANLSDIYSKFGDSICMDIVDTMNISRTEWSKLGCASSLNLTIGYPDILTSLTVGATPLMFYLLAKNVSRLEDVKLVRPKRKITVVVPSEEVAS